MNIACASGVERLMDYTEGVIAADLAAAIEAHVASCERCTAFIASYRATPRLLRDATAVTLPDDRRLALRTFLSAARTPRNRP